MRIQHPRAGDRRRDRSRVPYETCLFAMGFVIVSIVTAPSAAADSTDLLRAAVAAARPAACPPLRSDPIIDHAADEINQTTDRWINNTARAVPETNAIPVL
jgi:hypothetical protein